jgi:hypothetical protein
MPARTPQKLTDKRLRALLAYADRGEDEIVATFEDKYGVDISGTNEEIRESVRLHGEVSVGEAMKAAEEYRAYRAAADILRHRNLRPSVQESTAASWQQTASKIVEQTAAQKVEHVHGPSVGTPFGPACAKCGRLESAQ